MTKKYFGTDGIRGAINSENINGDMFFKFGLASGTYFKSQKKRKQTAIIAKDTRLSGYTLEPALVSGLASAGMHVYTLGPLPTNGLAMLTKVMRANMGIMITASHNPHSDNGLKLFGPDGMKLSDKIEKKIEKLIDAKNTKQLTNPKLLGRVKRLEDGNEKYIEILKKNFPKNFNLKGLKIVLDCANGATFKTSPEILKAYGADLVLLGVDPNGSNINEGVGSECPSSLSEAVLQAGADLGLAHDGDGDRLVVCDEKGAIVLGDVLLGIYALDALKYSALGSDTLVVTVQSNLGLDFAVKEAGGRVERVDVGDRNVAEKMRAIGSNLGGESSGHILFSDVCPTGDGLLAALQLLRIVQSANKPLSELSRGIDLFPQETKNLKVVEKTPLEQLPGLQSALIEAEALLSGEGRILLRYSGTEPKLRILVEAKTSEMVKKVMQIVVTEACNGLRVL